MPPSPEERARPISSWTAIVAGFALLLSGLVLGCSDAADSAENQADGPSGEVFDTVTQRDIGWGYAGHLWLEPVDESDEFLTRDEAMEHFRDRYPEYELREPAQLVWFESDLVDEDGRSLHPHRNRPAMLEGVWAFVLDVPEPSRGSNVPPADDQIRILYLDARSGEFAMSFEGVKKDPDREHPDGWRE